METKLVICTSCGSPIDNLDLNSKIGICKYCGNKLVIENALDLSKVEIDKTIDLKNNRELLKKALVANDIRNIERYANKILAIIPNDYSAKYYFAYAENALGKNTYITDFYNRAPDLCTEDEINTVLHHIIKYSDLRDRAKVESYIMAIEEIDNFKYINDYKQVFKEKRALEENYDDIPRDVFICHRSTDVEIAEQVLKVLEEDGNKCWISTRNLRPNDSDNYWDNITKAIKSCKLFLVISSEDAMLSNDVKNEINIAKSNNKPRIEYKIDDAIHTSFFKDFFDGCKWIDGTNGDEKNLIVLCHRVYDKLNNTENIKNKTNEIEEIKELLLNQNSIKMDNVNTKEMIKEVLEQERRSAEIKRLNEEKARREQENARREQENAIRELEYKESTSKPRSHVRISLILYCISTFNYIISIKRGEDFSYLFILISAPLILQIIINRSKLKNKKVIDTYSFTEKTKKGLKYGFMNLFLSIFVTYFSGLLYIFFYPLFN